jgi:hypothetical protein
MKPRDRSIPISTLAKRPNRKKHTDYNFSRRELI